LKDSEQVKLLKAAPAWLRRILIVAPETCLSEGDLLRLTDDMIDLEEGVIVPEGGRVKTEVEQISPITSAVRAVLQEIRAERSKVASISKLVFTKDGRPVTKDTLRRGLATACKKAGVKGFTFHDYRHAAKTKWVGQGIPVEAAMKAAGHKSVAMHNRYVHLQKSDVARAVGTLLKSCTNENGAGEGSAASI
jgi:integrase